jgi:citrate synthase
MLIEVPRGLNGVAVTDTTIGDVLGDVGRFHYRGHDATALARTHTFDDVWHLVALGHLPTPDESQAFRARMAAERVLPPSLVPVLEPLSLAAGARLGRVRAALSVAADDLGLRPLVDLTPDERADQALAVSAVVPVIVAALHRAGVGLPPVVADADLGFAGAYLQMVTGERPTAAAARALEQYLMVTIDHGFNASTFTARVVAATGADLSDVVGAALGALAGPLHGGAPSRALDALDAIGDPARTEAWVAGELAAGRRIMGFGHAVYRAHDPRSDLLREVALGMAEAGVDAELVRRAIDVERRILATLAAAKPDRQLPSNVEFFAGVVMAGAGLPRSMFTPTFAVSRNIAWCTHAVEQAAEGKLIRPSARYVGELHDLSRSPATQAARSGRLR